MVNAVTLIGRIGRDSELKYTTSGVSIASFSMATNEKYKDKEGNYQEKTEWHNIKMFGKRAEGVSKYLTKGKIVYILGSMQTTSWEKDGVKRYSTDVIANEVKFLGGEKSNTEETPQETKPVTKTNTTYTTEDIPF